MATLRIIARCDHCYTEEEFESEEDFLASDWWDVRQSEMELLYCGRECLVRDLMIPDDGDYIPHF